MIKVLEDRVSYVVVLPDGSEHFYDITQNLCDQVSCSKRLKAISEIAVESSKIKMAGDIVKVDVYLLSIYNGRVIRTTNYVFYVDNPVVRHIEQPIFHFDIKFPPAFAKYVLDKVADLRLTDRAAASRVAGQLQAELLPVIESYKLWLAEADSGIGG